MHELWLCKNILEIVIQHAANTKCRSIKTIYLEIGNLAAIEKSALEFSFKVVTQGTVAENAELKFIEVTGKSWCDSCQKEVIITEYYESCQYCGSPLSIIIQGEELRVKSMEVE